MSPPPADTGGRPSPTLTERTPPVSHGPLAWGNVLGGRYEVRGLLGRGGMGEVWQARDLKLQVDVALKAVLAPSTADERGRLRLRDEVRAARVVASPNVCRIYDLVEAEGLELVSMEYVDGTTLRHVLEEASPLELGEARDIALQLLAGLSAIHAAGLVHRDVKPENVMRTRSGRVVLMDFGIAREAAAGGTIAGTPAYMSPEQERGVAADPRSDVFAAGIVLAEMVAPGGVRGRERREQVWRAVRGGAMSGPWAEVVRRAVSGDPDARFASAQAFARALEEVTHRVVTAEDERPYPGLSAFGAADSGYFFGREAEVEEAWRKLPHRHLLAVVGPSGAGKTSFLRAGLIPARPEGWVQVACTPSDDPFVALGQALVGEVSRDTDAMRQMLRFADADVAVGLFRRWRDAHAEALVVVDQFEELFTLNPAEVQARFAALLARLALEADVHVLLAIRDDFLFRCQEHEGLRPLFEGLVPLGPPAGEALRRALVQPALKCGYRFEDDSFVADMLHAVEGERGALPLLAFAAASLWDRRDREQGALTRAAHDAIGGVAGALAQHAEATLDRVGPDRLPIVRELFRNLVTAHGTRDVRDVAELLTVFPETQRADAGAVLKTLIDARLLTSFEAGRAEPREHAGRRVELVHESLLTAWPRLVRWRTEDEGSSQLRDQLRQAAHLWEEKGRPEDLLWTGTSFQEYQVWRARYPGGLSEAEESFGRAMVARAGRRRRMRRLAVAAVLAGLLGVLGVVGTSLRRTRAALARSDASGLVSLGRAAGVEKDPTAVLAYATASLGRADTAEGRLLALEALAHGPVALNVTSDEPIPKLIAISPDGMWLAMGAPPNKFTARVWSRDGTLTTFPVDTEEWSARVDLAGEPPVLVTNVNPGNGTPPQWGRAWELPNGRLLGQMTWTHPASLLYLLKDPARLADLWLGEGRATLRTLRLREGAVPEVTSFDMHAHFREWPKYQVLVATKATSKRQLPAIDPAGRWLAIPVGREIVLQPLTAGAPPRVLARHAAPITRMAASPDGRIVAAADAGGETRLWAVDSGAAVASLRAEAPAPGTQVAAVPNHGLQFSEDGATLLQADGEPGGVLRIWRLSSDAPEPGRTIPLPANKLRQGMILHGFEADQTARWVVVSDAIHPSRVWNLRWPADARPVALLCSRGGSGSLVRIERNGAWAATSALNIALWPLSERAPRILDGHSAAVNRLTFAPDGSWLASTSEDGSVRLRPLAGDMPRAARQLVTAAGAGELGLPHGIDVSGDGHLLLLGFYGRDTLGRVALRPIDGELRVLPMSDNRESSHSAVYGVALSHDGRLAAAGGAHPGESIVRIWDVANGHEITRLDAGDKSFIEPSLAFLPDGTLAAGGPYGVLLWDVTRKTSRRLWAPERPGVKGTVTELRCSANGRLAFQYWKSEEPQAGYAYVLDLVRGAARRLASHGDQVHTVAIDPTGTIVVTGSGDGVVRVGPATGETPHLLLGHTGPVTTVAISRSGVWIASGGEDTTVRLWPMPDLSKPPAHTLPLGELLAKLKAQTNLRAVADPAAPGGYRLESGPFPGWAEVPEWQP